MNKLRKNLFLGVIIVAASIFGFFVKSTENQGYIVENETYAKTANATASPATTADTLLPGELININTATLSELQYLKGIGPYKAKNIIRYREKHGAFKLPEDIMRVNGIGRKIFDDIKDYITV